MKRIVLFLVALLVSSVFADTLYEQRPHTPGAQGGNGLSNFQGVLTGVTYDRLVADDFAVPSDVRGWRIDEVQVSGVWFANVVTDWPTWQVMFFAKTNGVPEETPVAIANVTGASRTNGRTYFSRTERIYDVTIDPVSLAPGEYYVMIHPTGTTDNFFQLTSTPNTPLQGTQVFVRGGPWSGGTTFTTWQPGQPTVFPAQYDVAFRLSGSVLPDGDVDRDGCVNDKDISRVLTAFGSTGSGLPEDLDGDEDVDNGDLAVPLATFAQGCE